MWRNSYRKGPQMVSLDEIIDAITSGGIEMRATQWARETIERSGMLAYKNEKKNHFRLFSVGALYDGVGWTADHVTYLNGFLMVDIDGVKSNEHAVMIRDGIFENSYLVPVMCFVSPSGLGVKALFRVKGLEGGGTMEEMQGRFSRAYRMVNAAIVHNVGGVFNREEQDKPDGFGGVTLDSSGEDMTRCCYVPYDNDVRFRKDVPYTPIDMDEKSVHKMLVKVGWDKDEEGVGENSEVVDDASCDVPKVVFCGTDEYSEDVHRKILDDIKKGLHRDEDGNYIYNRETVLHIGSRSEGTADVEVDGGNGVKRGYSLKLCVNSVAMWLYDGDKGLADTFLRGSFPEYRTGNWNRVSRRHGEKLPVIGVVNWVLRELRFSRDINISTTMLTLSDTSRPVDYICDDFYIKSMLPPVLNRWLSEDYGKKIYNDIAFYSALVAVSGFAPNQSVVYGATYGLNMQMLVVGSQGQGKGCMKKPLNHLVEGAFSRWCDYLDWKEARRYENERMSGTAWETEDGESGGYSHRPLRFANEIGDPTFASILQLLPSNNAKCVLTTTELSVWAEKERGSYGGIIDIIKLTYDGETISNETAKSLRSGETTRVYNPNMAILASGTHDAYHSLFKSPEGGELRRGMMFMLPKHEWKTLPKRKSVGNYNDIESMFVQWYMYHFWRQTNRYYILNDDDYEKMQRLYDSYVPKLQSVWGGDTRVDEAQWAVIGSVIPLVMRIAAIIQSLTDFHNGGKWIADITADDYLSDIQVWNDVTKRYESHTDDDYIAVVRERMKGIPLPIEEVELRWEFMEIAHKLMHTRLFDALDMLESHSHDSMMKDVSSVTKGLKYQVALDACPQIFKTADYAKMLASVCGQVKVNDSIVNKNLKKLISRGYIEKTARGEYTKK